MAERPVRRGGHHPPRLRHRHRRCRRPDSRGGSGCGPRRSTAPRPRCRRDPPRRGGCGGSARGRGSPARPATPRRPPRPPGPGTPLATRGVCARRPPPQATWSADSRNATSAVRVKELAGARQLPEEAPRHPPRRLGEPGERVVGHRHQLAARERPLDERELEGEEHQVAVGKRERGCGDGAVRSAAPGGSRDRRRTAPRGGWPRALRARARPAPGRPARPRRGSRRAPGRSLQHLSQRHRRRPAPQRAPPRGGSGSGRAPALEHPPRPARAAAPSPPSADRARSRPPRPRAPARLGAAPPPPGAISLRRAGRSAPPDSANFRRASSASARVSATRFSAACSSSTLAMPSAWSACRTSADSRSKDSSAFRSCSSRRAGAAVDGHAPPAPLPSRARPTPPRRRRGCRAVPRSAARAPGQHRAMTPRPGPRPPRQRRPRTRREPERTRPSARRLLLGAARSHSSFASASSRRAIARAWAASFASTSPSARPPLRPARWRHRDLGALRCLARRPPSRSASSALKSRLEALELVLELLRALGTGELRPQLGETLLRPGAGSGRRTAAAALGGAARRCGGTGDRPPPTKEREVPARGHSHLLAQDRRDLLRRRATSVNARRCGSRRCSWHRLRSRARVARSPRHCRAASRPPESARFRRWRRAGPRRHRGAGSNSASSRRRRAAPSKGTTL